MFFNFFLGFWFGLGWLGFLTLFKLDESFFFVVIVVNLKTGLEVMLDGLIV